MNAMGWQIGAVLFGASALIIAIYIAKLLNSTTKVVENANRLITYNERHIQDIIENTASITESVDEIIEVATKVTSMFKVFRIFKSR
ncbi:MULTISPECIES: DUF948 domain-containing protein [unclassified Romboutsia]|uniref:DUF948 domain-containing protein n=1 Tax=unclassified Romboutsia TaxID=2626894 RepID=UPI00082257C2|nr:MULTISPECIES: DUF948 domain-containing protein [unclassified Romboutsia]SCI28590.1 Uncharacterized protein containing a divergent version of the methyl-accepting chemotaxis-like domain [uncultured Clostridium sp.]